ncbi:gluconokinase [Pedobacter sp. JCM 36344]|uniref:gluconokinase n=1 Tax=Pedobacter sp. JCM 36344 TaxID=3374280 RepID=UPI00397997D4
MEYLLGIDIGTGSTKAVAVGLGGETLSVHQVYNDTKSTQGGFAEQDPEAIWIAFKTCLLTFYDKLSIQPLAISLSSAMHGLILADEHNELLSPMITWADSRSAAIAARIKDSEAGKWLYERTGTPIHAMSPLCKIIWFRENQPALFEKLHRVFSIKEYIWYKLFAEFAVDHSIASSTGLFNIHSLEWDSQALELAGIFKEQLSTLVQTDYTRSGLELRDQSLSAFASTQFVIGASDGCLANLGSLAIEPGIAALTIGTSGAVRVASRIPIINYPAMTFNYVLDNEFFICGGAVNNGGSAVQWLLKNIFGESELTEIVYTQLFKRISQVEAGSDSLLFLPYLSGERAPLWDSDSCGTFFGLRLHHSRPQLARAVLEGICFTLYEVLQVVESNGEAITQLNVSGGFVQSEVWMQILADITGKKLVLIQEEDASAIGAVILAAKTLKLNLSLNDKNLHSILPNIANHETYQKIFPIFKALYLSLKPLMKQLQQLNH